MPETNDTDTPDESESASILDNVSRRRVLQGATTMGALGLFAGAGSAQISNSALADTYAVGLEADASYEVATSRAMSVNDKMDFGELGKAVIGIFKPEAVEELRGHEAVRYVETVEATDMIKPPHMDEYVVGLEADASYEVATSRAISVDHKFDFGKYGKAVSGRFSQTAISELRGHEAVRYVETIEAGRFAMATAVYDGTPGKATYGVMLEPDASYDIATSHAVRVTNTVSYGAIGNAVIGVFFDGAITDLRKRGEVQYVRKL